MGGKENISWSCIISNYIAKFGNLGYRAPGPRDLENGRFFVIRWRWLQFLTAPCDPHHLGYIYNSCPKLCPTTQSHSNRKTYIWPLPSHGQNCSHHLFLITSASKPFQRISWQHHWVMSFLHFLFPTHLSTQPKLLVSSCYGWYLLTLSIFLVNWIVQCLISSCLEGSPGWQETHGLWKWIESVLTTWFLCNLHLKASSWYFSHLKNLGTNTTLQGCGEQWNSAKNVLQNIRSLPKHTLIRPVHCLTTNGGFFLTKHKLFFLLVKVSMVSSQTLCGLC